MKKKPILRIENPDSTIKFEAQDQVLHELNPDTIAKINSILGDKGYVRGTYIYKFPGGQKLAGKTGTSDANKDTYYIGYGPKIVTGVWCGNNDNTRLKSSAFGSSTALLIWNGYMSSFLANFPEYGEYGHY
jgi:penicillin-binding protein 1A